MKLVNSRSSDLFQTEKSSRERTFFAVMSQLSRPASFLHVGCGDGWLVRCARQLGATPALGIGTEHDRELGRQWAPILVMPLDAPIQLDCARACSFHLVWNDAETSADNLSRHVANHGRLVTSVQFTEQSLGMCHDFYHERALRQMGLQYEVFKWPR